MKYWQGWLVIMALGSPVLAQELQPVTIRFQAGVGDKPFACGENYSKLAKVPVTVADFRLYLSDLALLDEKGQAIPLTLDQDGRWQYQNIALLDFENKTGACSNGTETTREVIVGQIPKGSYRGLKFTLGIPASLNHADATLASAPLNLTSLWWNWQYGYKFLRLDLEVGKTATPAHSHDAMHMKEMGAMKGMEGMKGMGGGGGSSFLIHLGSAGCDEPAGPRTRCQYPNRAEVLLPTFDPKKNLVRLDIAALLKGTNLTQNQPETGPGCMSEPNDQDCAGILAHLGMGKATQTFFQVR